MSPADAVAHAQSALAARRDPDKAAAMQSYMKTEMPFYGVQKPGREPILRHLVREFAPADREEYEAIVTALWELPHREEKYLARGVAAGSASSSSQSRCPSTGASSSRVPGGTSSTRPPRT